MLDMHFFPEKTRTPEGEEWNLLGGGFKDFLFSTLPGEMIRFDLYFQLGWNHQLDEIYL